MSVETLVNRQHKKHLSLTIGAHPIMLRSMSAWSDYKSGTKTYWNAMARGGNGLWRHKAGTPGTYDGVFNRKTLNELQSLSETNTVQGANPIIRVDSNDYIHMCYITVDDPSGVGGWDIDEVDTTRLMYVKETAVGVFGTPVAVTRYDSNQALGNQTSDVVRPGNNIIDMVLDSDNNPHIVYCENNTNALRYARYKDNVLQADSYQTVFEQADSGAFDAINGCKISIDNNNKLHIATFSGTDSDDPDHATTDGLLNYFTNATTDG
ncbi:MAG: hypothetical protein CMM25_08250, partial [Rhodospirillaceae bacterium]|nr:hypothetical protein [Rhodospirillaceae bacterium]